MTELPKDKLDVLRRKIALQRNTVQALRREGHEFTDAERQLRLMQTELEASEAAGRRGAS